MVQSYVLGHPTSKEGFHGLTATTYIDKSPTNIGAGVLGVRLTSTLVYRETIVRYTYM